MSNIKNKIAELLKNSEIDIKPKWHFVIKTYMLIFAIITLILILSFVSSFIVFTSQSIPSHRLIDIMSNLYILPWIIVFILLSILTMVLLFSRTINFIYKIPTIFLILTTIFFVITLSLVVERYKVHDKIFKRIDREDYKYIKKMYLKKSLKDDKIKKDIKIEEFKRIY